MRALEFIIEAEQRQMEPELYEEVPNSILKKAVQAALPGVKLQFRTTPEGYLNVTNDDDSVRLDIGMSIYDSELSFNIENAYLTKHAKGGAMTAIIANAFALAEKKYGIPRARSLNIEQDRSYGVWQHIANKLGLEYSAHQIGESAESIQESVHAYHGTFQPTLTRFNALSHFGTLQAAEDRLKEKARREKIKDPGRVYEVVLDIKNPFIAKDFAGVHSPTHFVFDLKTAKLISQAELEAINRHMGTPKQAQLLIKKLRELGFDSIAYKNKYEDKGSTSYVILDPTQVVSVRPLKQQEAVTEARIPDEIEDFLYDLTPEDVGVEEFGPYRVHYEGFTDDCQSSSDYCADPEAVYQQVFADHIAREGGRKPVEQNFTGDEDYPILYSIFKIPRGVKENFPQPGDSSGKARQFKSNAKIQTKEMTLDQILNSVRDIPYVNNVVDDWDAKDYSWNVTKKVIEYAQYLLKNPQSVANLPPLVVIDGRLEDGAHRLSAINLLQKRMDPKNPLWKQVKLKVNFGQSADVVENFADGKVKGKSRPGRVKKAGASCKGSVSSLRAKAKKYGGERGKMYHWCANMKGGKKK